MTWLEFLRDKEQLGQISNINTRVVPYSEGIPMSIGEENEGSSYVTSILSAIINTDPGELARETPWNRFLLRATALFLRPLLKSIQINKAVIINNWMIWTNLLDRSLFDIDRKTVDILTGQYPGHMIVIRSLNIHYHQTLLNKLQQLDFLLFPTSNTYIYDKALKDFSKSRNFKADTKLLKKSEYVIKANEQLQPEHILQLKELYQKLYLEKHSSLAPDYSLGMFQTWADDPQVDLYALTEENNAIGFVGLWIKGSQCSVPCIGYDPNRPDALAVYRQLTALVLNQAHEKDLSVNFGMGADSFKSMRGAKPFTEYMAVYARHLNPWRVMVLTALSLLCRKLKINVCE